MKSQRVNFWGTTDGQWMDPRKKGEAAKGNLCTLSTSATARPIATSVATVLRLAWGLATRSSHDLANPACQPVNDCLGLHIARGVEVDDMSSVDQLAIGINN